jgi:hypothetical protein
VTHLRRLNPGGDPLKTSTWVVEDKLDRIHATGEPPGSKTATTDKLGELRA